MEEKKFIKSSVAILLYIMAALSMIYTFYQIGSTVSYINSYYSSYGMTAGISEIVTYVLQTVFQPFVLSILLFAAAYILNQVRALNPANYVTAEELALRKQEKAAAKAAKKTKTADAVDADDVVTLESEGTEALADEVVDAENADEE